MKYSMIQNELIWIFHHRILMDFNLLMKILFEQF